MPTPAPVAHAAPRAKLPLVGILLVSALLGLGLARRLQVTTEYRNFAGDGWQYYHLAQTLTNEGRYAFGPKPLPLAWTRLPGYPLFLAVVGVGTPRFNEGDVALRATKTQAGLDLLTALFAFLLAAEAGLSAPRYLALALCLASPLLALCTSYILSESLAVLLTTATLWLLLRAGRTRLGLHLAVAGALAGFGLLVRADAVTLLPCFAVPLLVTRESIGARARAALFAALAATLVFAPWPLRNLVRFGSPHLLGSSWVSKMGDPLPTGVQAWLSTWAVEPEAATVDIAWKMTRGTPVYAATLPNEAFDSPEEQKRVNALFEQYSREGLIGPAVDAGFRALAKERRARDPVRFFVKLPLRRAEVLWMRAVPDWEMPIASPTLALRNCLPAALLPIDSSDASFRNRCRNDVCAGSMPTSNACSQLQCHMPLNANTWVDGAAKQSNSGKGGSLPGSPSQANSTPLRSITG